MQNERPYDAIIILGGGRIDETTLTTLSIQRLDRGVELYFQGLAEKVFALGDYYPSYSASAIRFERTGAELRKSYLTEHGIPEGVIIKVEDGRDTLYEALASRKMAESLGIHSILLVTSDKHMPRALLIFNKVFGNKSSIEGAAVPCGDLLNEKEEAKYYELVQRLFTTYPENIPYPQNWETWYKDNRWFYEELEKIHKGFMQGGTETNQAYMRVKERK